MKGPAVLLRYQMGDRRCRIIFDKSLDHPDFKAEILDEPGNPRRFRLLVTPLAELEILELEAGFDFSYQDDQRIFVNGYQSWTETRERTANERMRGIPWYAAPVLPKYQIHKYGDYTFYRYPWRKGVFHGFTYSYVRSGKRLTLLGSLSEANGFTIIEHDVKRGRVTLKKDCAGLHVAGPYEAFDVLWMEGTEQEVFDAYFERMGIAKSRVPRMTGWTSWYNYYQNISEPIILENLDHFRERAPEIGIFQIDDGFQTAVGDWLSVDSTKFPRGMKAIADATKAAGFKAGLWLAPFACEAKSALFREHPDWTVRDAQGRPLLAGSNWSRFYALDLYHPEVRSYLKHVFSVVLDEWGYDMVKLDFLYAACLQPRPDRTRGGIMTDAMEFLRECVGEKLILGCGVPLGPAFGRVDYCRIGSDVGLDWNDKWYMRGLLREKVSTYNAIADVIGRRHLDGRAFMNDPDVFLLRDENIQLSETQKNTLLTVNATFGSLLFTSDDIGQYDEDKMAKLGYAFRPAERGIQRVERDERDLVEIVLAEEGEKRLILMNLGGKSVDIINYWGRIGEIRCGMPEREMAPKEIIRLQPYETRSFRLQG